MPCLSRRSPPLAQNWPSLVRPASFGLSLVLVAALGCRPSLETVGEERGCPEAERQLYTYIVKDQQKARMRKDAEARGILLPAAVAGTLAANIIGGSAVAIPVVAPEGINIKTPKVQTLLEYKATKGSELDTLENRVVVRQYATIGRCYAREGDCERALWYFDRVEARNAAHVVPPADVAYYRASCQDNLGHPDAAVHEYQHFLNLTHPPDSRRARARDRIAALTK